jgi:hypothetical protein
MNQVKNNSDSDEEAYMYTAKFVWTVVVSEGTGGPWVERAGRDSGDSRNRRGSLDGRFLKDPVIASTEEQAISGLH